MSIDEAIQTVRDSEAREHRANGAQRGMMVHEAFEIVIKAAESFLRPQKMQLK